MTLRADAPACACAACAFAVLPEPFGSSSTCPVCGWVDDLVQLAHPDLAVGANSGLSLRQAQSAALVLHPLALEVPVGLSRDPRWRSPSPGEHPPAPAFTPASPVCCLTAPDPETFGPYWLAPPPDTGLDT